MKNHAKQQVGVGCLGAPSLKSPVGIKRKPDPKFLRIQGVDRNGKPFSRIVYLLDDSAA